MPFLASDSKYSDLGYCSSVKIPKRRGYLKERADKNTVATKDVQDSNLDQRLKLPWVVAVTRLNTVISVIIDLVTEVTDIVQLKNKVCVSYKGHVCRYGRSYNKIIPMVLKLKRLCQS